MSKALFAGSFDPFTMGHLDTVERVSKVFEELYIAIATNTNKTPLLSSDERKMLIEEAVQHLNNVRVIDHSSALTVDLARDLDCTVLVRGVRSVKDYQYEADIAAMNRSLNPDIETLFIMSDPQYSFVSSSMIKEVMQFGGDVSGYLPENIERALVRKYKHVTDI